MAIDQIQRLLQQIVARFIVEHLRRHATSERIGGIWQVGKSCHCSKRQRVCESCTTRISWCGLDDWLVRSKICPPSLGYILLKRSKRASVVKSVNTYVSLRQLLTLRLRVQSIRRDNKIYDPITVPVRHLLKRDLHHLHHTTSL
jgi:hypothetical protein